MSKRTLENLRIVDISPYTPLAIGFGGIARSTGAYLAALTNISANVTLISTTTSLRGRVTSRSVELAYPGLRACLYNAIFSKKWAVGPGLFAKLPVLFGAEIVVIHSTRNWPSVIGAFFCRIFRKRYYVVAHATLDVTRMKRTRSKRPVLYRLTSAAVIWSVRGAAGIIVSGALERGTLPDAVRNVRTIEIENFYDFDLDRVTPGEFASNKSYLFVGRIESDKGILSFINIWKQVAAPTSKLTIAGTGTGKYFDDVISAIHADSRIDYKGELASGSIRELMRQSSIVVLPTGLDASVTENFGNTVAEALIAGRPAMVTRGLHWDQYELSPAIRRFCSNASSVAVEIKKFDAVDFDTYKIMAAAAVELSRRFHISKAIVQLKTAFDEDMYEE